MFLLVSIMLLNDTKIIKYNLHKALKLKAVSKSVNISIKIPSFLDSANGLIRFHFLWEPKILL